MSYAGKIKKHEAQIDWRKSAIEIERKVRAFNSWPVAYSYFNNKRIRIWSVEVVDKECLSTPGEIISATKSGIEVATGHGVLSILNMQIAGGNIISALDFINSHDLHNQRFYQEQSTSALSTSA